MKHTIKSKREYFDAVVRGEKTFEIRANDRNYQKGDTILLCRTQEDYSRHDGEYWQATIGDVHHAFGLQDGWCAFSLLNGRLATEDDYWDKGT